MLNLWCNKQRLLPFIALLLGTQACFNESDFDPDMIAGVKASPSVAVPLLHGSLKMQDLLAQTESQYVEVDPDNLIHLIYSDTLYSTSIRDHFLLPELSAQKFYLTGAKTVLPGSSEVIVDDQLSLDFEFEEVDLIKIQLKEGDLSLSAYSNIQTDVELQLNFPTLSQNGQPLVVNMSLPAGAYSSQSLQLSLQNFDIDLSQFEAGENLLPVEVLATVAPGQENLLLGTNDYVQFSLNLSRLDFNLITGHFGQLEVALPQEELAIELFENIPAKANFSLENPMLRFDFLNSNGAPIQVKKEILQARTETGETLPIVTDPADLFDLSAPALPGQSSVTSISITNVGKIIDLRPNFMDYKLTGKLNVGQPQDIINFVTDSSRSGIVLHADVPLWGSIDGYHLSDTMAMTLQPDDAELQEDEDGGFTIENANASIHTVITNQFPLGSEVQVYFTNARYEITDSLFSEGPLHMKASKVNASGDLQTAEVTTLDPTISDKQLERILESDYMIIKGLLYTSRNADGSQPAVKIKSDYQLDINLGLKASMNISVK